MRNDIDRNLSAIIKRVKHKQIHIRFCFRTIFHFRFFFFYINIRSSSKTCSMMIWMISKWIHLLLINSESELLLLLLLSLQSHLKYIKLQYELYAKIFLMNCCRMKIIIDHISVWIKYEYTEIKLKKEKKRKYIYVHKQAQSNELSVTHI